MRPEDVGVVVVGRSGRTSTTVALATPAKEPAKLGEPLRGVPGEVEVDRRCPRLHGRPQPPPQVRDGVERLRLQAQLRDRVFVGGFVAEIRRAKVSPKRPRRPRSPVAPEPDAFSFAVRLRRNDSLG